MDTCLLCDGRGEVEDPNNCGGCETCTQVFGDGPNPVPCPICYPKAEEERTEKEPTNAHPF